MDSGNSSSMQSSSGGGGDQEEFDSRADQSISAFFNQNNNTTTNIATGPTNLDSLIANYLNTSWSTDTPLWSTTPRPPPTQPISSSEQQVFFTNPSSLPQQQQQQNLRVSDTTNTSNPMCSSVPTDIKNSLTTTRNPKKRSRVSKRAPTTVLTTDTSNFRAMVQEFTGNPSTPFTGLLPSSSTFPRSRFDHLFGPSSSSSSPTSMTSSSSSSRPLKPFPHKLISPSTSHHHHHPYLIPPPSSDYNHQSLLLNMNTQNIANPFLNNQSSSNPLTDSPLLSEKSRPSSLMRTSNTGFGHVDFGGLHNVIATQPPNLNVNQGNKSREAEDGNDLLRSINGDHQSTVQRSDVSGSVRNEGMVELSWISSSD